MPGPLVAIFHQAPRDGDAPLSRLLAEARGALLAHQLPLFERAGARRVAVLPGRDATPRNGESFGERLVRLLGEEPDAAEGLIVMGSGAVPLLRSQDADRLVATARRPGRRAVTNNRYSSDICAISDAAALHELPRLPTDNGLPRWLEEVAGFEVSELPGRDRLALDLDTPLDLALLSLARGAPPPLRRSALASGIAIPRLEELRQLAADPRRELLVAGRSGSRTLRWLERNVRCRVRFLSEERGLRASLENARPPRSSLGRLLELRGPASLPAIVAELADGAIIDSRILLADRLGARESAWPPPEDRFASDLLRPEAIADAWLAELTRAAASSAVPILLGAHTIVGPGVPLLLARPAATVTPGPGDVLRLR